MLDVERWTFSESRYLWRVKFLARIFFLLLAPLAAFASNSVVNLSHYDLMRVDFVAMKNEGVVGVIHEASFPRLQRDWRYGERQIAASQATLIAMGLVPPGSSLEDLYVNLLGSQVAGYYDPAYRDVSAFVILVLFLLFRPQGILADVVVQREIVA